MAKNSPLLWNKRRSKRRRGTLSPKLPERRSRPAYAEGTRAPPLASTAEYSPLSWNKRRSKRRAGILSPLGRVEKNERSGVFSVRGNLATSFDRRTTRTRRSRFRNLDVTASFPLTKTAGAVLTLPRGESILGVMSRVAFLFLPRMRSGSAALLAWGRVKSAQADLVRGKLAIRLGWKCSRRGLRESQHWGGATPRTNGVASSPPPARPRAGALALPTPPQGGSFSRF